MFFYKNKGDNRAEAWIEVWVHNDWKVVCDAYLILTPDEILVDDIKTEPEFRRQGYATSLIEHLKLVGLNNGKKIVPIGIKNMPDAQGFWKSLEMEDALGKEMTLEEYLAMVK